VYNKSAVVLHMLRRMMGDEAFFRGVRRFYFRSRFRKAGTGDVREAFEKEGGRSLEAFFRGWIEGSGTPQVQVTWTRDAGASPPVAVLRVEQRGKTFEFPVTATVEYANGTAEDTPVVVRERAGEFRLPLKGDVKSITLNRDGLTPLEVVGR
jgi:aminopeptidase N